MKQELIKPIIKVGNSAGVLLPREWLNGKARIELVEKPLDINKEVLQILEPYLEDVVGIYIVGSYARHEETEESDIDILAITQKTEKHIKPGKYDILLIPKEIIEQQLEKDALPILPMLIEAKPILNKGLLDKYKKAELTKDNLKYHIETTKSALNVVREDIKAAKELNQKVSDASAYSLILRLRTLYIIECIKNQQICTKKKFLSLVKKITGSLSAYNLYRDVKNNKKPGYKLEIKEAEKLSAEINKRLEQVEKWLKEKKG